MARLHTQCEYAGCDGVALRALVVTLSMTCKLSYELFISVNFLLIFLSHGWPEVTKIADRNKPCFCQCLNSWNFRKFHPLWHCSEPSQRPLCSFFVKASHETYVHKSLGIGAHYHYKLQHEPAVHKGIWSDEQFIDVIMLPIASTHGQSLFP